MGNKHSKTVEHQRLADSEARLADWKNWGPYLSERSWGTVREDYSPAVMPGITSRTTTLAAALTVGTKTDWVVFATGSKIFALLSLCGTNTTRTLRSGYSVWRVLRATTVRMSRNITSTWTELPPTRI